MRFRLLVFAVFLVLPLAVWAALPLVSSAGKAEHVQAQISTARAKLDRLRKRERLLSTDVAAFSRRIESLQGEITPLQRRQDSLQTSLDRERSELDKIQAELRRQRARLARARAKLAVARKVLGRRLTELYKADRPDIVTVILNANGWADLLERTEFIGRINDQDARIIRSVRLARDEAKRASDRLGQLERRQERITQAVLARRNEVASVRLRLVEKRGAAAGARSEKAAALGGVRSDKSAVQEDLASLEREQAKVRGVLAGAGGPVRRGTGRFIWPVNGSITGTFGENRGDHIHVGLDIAAPNGTPIHAADSGKVVLASYTGGYGNYTCIAHGGGVSTCYAHQSSIATSVGANVSQGQVIGYVGNTGHSFGDHLHFEVRINGSPVNPANYL